MTDYRCLEEGAEEFFLKPVQLANLKKLKPHLMKTKLKDQEVDKPDEIQEKSEENLAKQEFLSEKIHLQT